MLLNLRPKEPHICSSVTSEYVIRLLNDTLNVYNLEVVEETSVTIPTLNTILHYKNTLECTVLEALEVMKYIKGK